MGGKSKQDKVKRDRRAVDMAEAEEGPAPDAWRPPDDECEEEASYTTTPPDADPNLHQVKLRVVTHTPTGRLVEFAMTQQTRHKGKWRDVAKADSSHNDEVHLHRYSRRSRGEVGNQPEVLTVVQSFEDLQAGYYLAYERVFGDWSGNYQRWHDA